MVKRREPLEQRVLDFIQKHCLIQKGSYLLVAVSGGADSVCLLHILVRLKDALGIELHVAHLNHQLRGAESESDAEYVANLAQSLAIAATIEKRHVKAYQAQKRFSLEEAAREVRYNFLAETARRIGTSQVATGHTKDDNIETILMHLIRGSGTRGLQGLPPDTEWRIAGNSLTIVRPLLNVSREETASYCQNHGLSPRLDSSNLSLSPLRNRIRLQLLPLLKNYNPRVAEALLRMAHVAADDLAFIEEEGARLWNQIAQRYNDAVTLNKRGLLELPSALKRQLLQKSLELLVGNLKDIESCHIEDMLNALNKPAGKRLNLPHGLTFVVEYERYLITKDPQALSPYPPFEEELLLTIPGETRLPGWQVEASIVSRKPITEEGDNLTACFDLERTGDKLVVRSRKPGDRFQPLGMSQPKKLNEFMIDAKIPRLWRERIPLVCSRQHIIWVVGWRIDERVKVTEDSKQVLYLSFRQR